MAAKAIGRTGRKMVRGASLRRAFFFSSGHEPLPTDLQCNATDHKGQLAEAATEPLNHGPRTQAAEPKTATPAACINQPNPAHAAKRGTADQEPEPNTKNNEQPS